MGGFRSSIERVCERRRFLFRSEDLHGFDRSSAPRGSRLKESRKSTASVVAGVADPASYVEVSNVIALWDYMTSLATRPAYSIRSSAISISRKDVSTGPRVCLRPSIMSVPNNLACNESIWDVMAAKRLSGLVRMYFINPRLRANEDPHRLILKYGRYAHLARGTHEYLLHALVLILLGIAPQSCNTPGRLTATCHWGRSGGKT